MGGLSKYRQNDAQESRGCRAGWKGMASPKVRGQSSRAPSLQLCGPGAGRLCPEHFESGQKQCPLSSPQASALEVSSPWAAPGVGLKGEGEESPGLGLGQVGPGFLPTSCQAERVPIWSRPGLLAFSQGG